MGSERSEVMGSGITMTCRAEVDTSAPFESVKEAVTRFGGFGFWKPSHHKHSDFEHYDTEEVDISKLEEQTLHLEEDLIVKEREALEVLEELDSTKKIVEELKLKLQKEAYEVNMTLEATTNCSNTSPMAKEEADKENRVYLEGHSQNLVEGLSPCSSAPGLILMELKQAKLNLTRTTHVIADIRASVDLLNKKLEKERTSLEKARERLTENLSKVSSLEEELNQTRLKLQVVKDAEVNGCSGSPLDISNELQRLSSEAEKFIQVKEAEKSEVLRTIAEIEQTRFIIKTAEIRLVAARKMKEAARAAEAVALAEIKVLSNHECPSGESFPGHGGVTLSYEEYLSLSSKAQEAEKLSKRRVIDAMKQVDEANASKMEIFKQVKEATEERKTSKMALEEALKRVDSANRAKLEVEESLRKWRAENGRKRRVVNSSMKFKNSGPVQHRRDSILEGNGLNLVTDAPTPVLKTTLSIGQILSRKLLVPENSESGVLAEKSFVKQKMSLGQMLGKENGDRSFSAKAEKDGEQKQNIRKRKKFGFAQFSLLLTKQKRKKKSASNKK